MITARDKADFFSFFSTRAAKDKFDDRASNKRGFAKLERAESSEANNGMSPL